MDEAIPTDIYTETAAAYVRGMCADAPAEADAEALVRFGRDAGLKMHRFKRTMGLPRVRAVIGVLRALAPETLLDIGTGLFADYNARVTIVYLETGPAEQARRNNERAEPVPAQVISRMLARWEVPDLTECHRLEMVSG